MNLYGEFKEDFIFLSRIIALCIFIRISIDAYVRTYRKSLPIKSQVLTAKNDYQLEVVTGGNFSKNVSIPILKK